MAFSPRTDDDAGETMKHASKAGTSLMAFVLLFSLSIVASAQLSNEQVRAIGERWLSGDCGLGSSLREELRNAATPALEAFFLAAVQNGPPSSEMLALEQAAAKRFEQRQQTLKRPEGLGLSREEVAEAQGVTREDFIAQEKRDFVSRYQSAAVSGLGIVGGTGARTELERLARDPKSPLQAMAERALAEMAQGK
jgi:hypothetical protein